MFDLLNFQKLFKIIVHKRK